MRLKIFCGFLLCIFACSKVNQWKNPTSICFDLALSSTQFLDGDLALRTGHLNISNFIFDGEREQGGDVYFSTDYDQLVQVPVKGPAIEAMTFDVPQGIYTAMNIQLGDENKPSTLILEGEWKPNNADPVFVQVELEKVEKWSIIGKNQARQQQPLELGAKKAVASIVLQPNFWITEEQRILWEMAETVLVNGRTTLLVNPTTNIELYQAVSKLFLAHTPCALVES
ncbi:MAG: hypothetical protein ACRBFS_24515 [Aureispira sp.]